MSTHALSSIEETVTFVVGVNYENTEGPSRQEAIAGCKPGDRVQLIRERSNPYDSNAVAVHNAGGVQLGYLGRDYAKEVSHAMSLKYRYTAYVVKVLDKNSDFPFYGLKLIVLCAAPATDRKDIRRHVKGLGERLGW